MRVAATLAVLCLLATSLGGIGPANTGSGGDLGVEGGYHYEDSIAVTGADGLNASERTAVTRRAMARIERLRGLEFTDPVDVSVVARENYTANHTGPRNASAEAWNNQVWKAPFLVGADRSVRDVFNDTYRSSVVGYYDPRTEDIVLISDSADPRVSRRTLVHELVHALQDQQFGLASSPETQDRQLARNALVEGEAERIATRYEQRCQGGWSCVEVPPAGGGGTAREPGRYQDAVFLVIYHPYAVGQGFVERVAEREGLSALNRLYADLPDSTEQIIHPAAFPGETPANVTVADRSTDEWRRFDHDPEADTVGEATIYAMAVVNDVGEPVGGRYSYRHPVSTGWDGDAVVPYRDGDRYGYVWETVWETPADAREFESAYASILDRRGAETLGANTHRLPAGSPFGGAYRLTREGATVRVVHGPTRASLAAIHDPPAS